MRDVASRGLEEGQGKGRGSLGSLELFFLVPWLLEGEDLGLLSLPESVEIACPGLHHLPSLIQELNPVIGRP